MAKPIVVIYFPENFVSGGSERNWIYEYMAYLNGEVLNGKVSYWPDAKGYCKDYYWFCFYKYNIDEPQIQVFYEKDFTDTQFSELKELILKNIEETNHDK